MISMIYDNVLGCEDVIVSTKNIQTCRTIFSLKMEALISCEKHKVVSMLAKKAYRRSRSSAPFVIILAIMRRVVNFTSQPLLPPKKVPRYSLNR
jgi:hypothetical protein